VQQQPSITIHELHKRVRNTRKKLARVEELESLRAAGNTLTPEQIPVLSTRSGLVAVLEELQKFEPLLREAAKEEVKQECQAAAAKAEQRTRERMEKEFQQREQEWQKERDALVNAREAAEEERKLPPSKARMQELLKEPLQKLLQLLYFSEVGVL